MIEPILESFLHLTSCKIFLDFYSMACYSESNLYVSLFYIQIFSPSKATIHFIFNLCRILCMFQLLNFINPLQRKANADTIKE